MAVRTIPIYILKYIQSTLPAWQWAITGIVSICLAVVSIIVSAVSTSPVSSTEKLVLAYTTFALGVLLWIVFRHFMLHGSIDEMNGRLAAQRDLMDLRPVAADKVFDEMKHCIVLELPKLRDMQDRFAFLNKDGIRNLIEDKLRDAFRSYSDVLTDLGRGNVRIETSHDEANTNFIFLETIPRSKVRAISYFDEVWWKSDRGRNFLECNRKVAAKKIEIERIFVLRTELNDTLKSLMTDQVEAGIKVSYVAEADLRGTQYEAEDFVVYDSTAVRVARLIDQDDPETPYEDKTAVLKLSNGVESYITKFNAISRSATRFNPPSPDKPISSSG